jgi:Helix-hairpin-helix motif
MRRPRRPLGLWAAASLFPFGLFTWAGFVAAAAKAPRRRRYAALAVLWLVLCWSAFTIDGLDGGQDDEDPGWLVLLAWGTWALSIVHSFVERPRWIAEVAGRGPHETPAEAARRRIGERARSRRLALDEPRVALEMGLGRPGVRRAAHGGVVDVNHATADEVARIPGVDEALARRICATRDELDGFSSAAELSTTLDLRANVCDDIAEHAVFLPRR